MRKLICFVLLASVLFLVTLPSLAYANRKYLGRLSSNAYDSESTSNQFGTYGSAYSPNSINNQFGAYGGQSSPQGVRNAFSNDGPKVYGSDGQFLGNLNSNQFDPNSVSNPFGRYGSQFSPTSVNNPFSKYGSQFSNQSANNAFATDAPIIVAD